MAVGFLGIDPGAAGAAVLLHGSNVRVCRFDKVTEREVVDFFKDITWDGLEVFACIEKIQALPHLRGIGVIGRGSISGFKLGASYGFLRGCLVYAGIPFEEVSPRKWQGVLGCLSKGDKRVTRAKAQNLFPHIKVVHAFADALLIAEYCRRIRQPGRV